MDFNSYIKLIFRNGKKITYPISHITIEQSILKNKRENNHFHYLKTLANAIGAKVNGDVSFLGKQYEQLSHISPRSVLAAYFGYKSIKSKSETNEHVIFPFGFNASQKVATERAMTNQLSVIEGPPGTGKTQTILNIIANAIINNKTVAIVSNNNSAIANVMEKLHKYELDVLGAYLGNKDNKDTFFTEQSGNYPNMSNWELDDETDIPTIKGLLREKQTKLNIMLKKQNQRAILRQELAELKTESEYFNQYYTELDYSELSIKSLQRLKSSKILKLLVEYQYQMDKGKISLSNKIYNLLVYGIINFQIYKEKPERIISYLQKNYYERNIKELTNKVQVLDKELGGFNFNHVMEEYSHESMRLLKASLVKRYGNKFERPIFKSNVIHNNFASFIKEYPVILSTTHSIRNCAADNYLFDYVLIDEASQVDIVTGALALSCAKNAVIVGDEKQLPNVVTEEMKEKATKIYLNYQMDNAYNYAEHSLLSSIVHLFPKVPKTLLKEHYRCHPKIIHFCNQKFYNNELVILTEEKPDDQPLILYKTVKGNHARGTINQRQIDVITKEVIPEENKQKAHQSIGVISPFRLQADEIQKALGNVEMESDTVHKYQGREKDIIILSTVSNQMTADDFADDANLINVAVSRAVNKLIVVTAEDSEEWDGTNIGDLIRYNNFEIRNSQIRSVFDLLYRSYSEKLLDMLRKNKRVSEHISENLMNHVMETVLNEEKFHSLGYVLHQPLRMLIKDTTRLTERERNYVMHPHTHTDFVIFNKMDKMVILVVEVDGHAFHANNPIQLERDRLKDTILEKYGIPILRLKTTGSEEGNVLREKLTELLKL